MADEKQTEEFVQKFGPKSSSRAEDSDQELAQALADPELKIKPVPEDFIPGASAASSNTAEIGSTGPGAPVGEGAPRRKERPDSSHVHRRRSKFTYWVHRHTKKIITVLAVVILVLLAVTAGLLIYGRDTDPYQSKLLSGISIAGVDVGGMTRQEAVQAIEKNAASFSDNDMVVYLNGERLTLPAANTLAALDVTGVVEAAYCIGRQGTEEEQQQILQQLQQEGMVIELLPYLRLDTGYIKAVLENAVSERNCPLTPSGYALEGPNPSLSAVDFSESNPCQTLLLTVGTPSIELDADSIYEAVLDAYNRREFQVEISAAQELPEAIDLDAIHAQLTIDPVEAVQDPKTLEVTPGSCGYTFCLEDAKAALAQASYGETISIPMEYVMPETLNITMEYPHRLALYTSPLGDNEAYDGNIALACQYLDGYVVEPGAVFSLKETLPPLTKANGFQFAPAHAEYCTWEYRGGGLDQLASTLHMAAICSEMTILQRTFAHHVCEYTLRGTEITVMGERQDFRFRNALDTPIQIHAKILDDELVISIFGQEENDYYCQLESEKSNTKGFHILMVGKSAQDGYQDQEVIREGINGGSTKVYRVYMDKKTGQEIKRVLELYVYLQPVDMLMATVK